MARSQEPSSHLPYELVVDLQHRPVVEEMLDALGVQRATPREDDVDERLGLVRLRDLTESEGAPVEVGELIALLRQRAARDRDGWQPLLGRNRIAHAVIGDSPSLGSDGLVGVASHKPMQGGEPAPAESSERRGPAAPETAGSGVRVGLVDTELHPGAAPSYRAGHATFVAGLIRRAAPAARIFPEAVLKGPEARAESWDIARAMMRLAYDEKVHILNLSLGSYTMAGGPPLVISRALERLPAEVLVVAAAGNHGALPYLTNGRAHDSGCWPAAHPRSIAVGAVDAEGRQPEWSAQLPWVNYLAPGVDVISDYLDGDVTMGGSTVHFGGLATWSGTSFAAATVSGLVAAGTVPGSVSPQQALAELVRAKRVQTYPQRP
jgi:membrane-anchored mycosin MYCP